MGKKVGYLTEKRRTLTASLRMMPDFLIIGGMKCGTSSLFHYLMRHPNIAGSTPKEVHYFDDFYHKGLKWYRGHFPLRFGKDAKPIQRCGEASPFYMFVPEAPARVMKLMPEARLVVMLRDPVPRAFSHYHHASGKGWDSRPFEESIEAELRHIASGGKEPLHPTLKRSDAVRRLQFLNRGVYADQLERWFTYFGREAIHVIRSEDMFTDTQGVYSRVLEHLGLPDHTPKKFKRRNTGAYKEPMSEATVQQLRDFYAPHNRRLEQLLNRDMGWGY